MERSALYRELRDRGLRMTALRREVVDIFLGGGCGLSAREVGDRVASGPHISTVHRCLGSLEEAGFLRRDRSSDGMLRYRPARRFVPDHGHFRCGRCGVVMPLDVSLPAELLGELETRNHIRIRAADIFVEGTCGRCSRLSGGSRR